jgi:hypothetical protein
MKRRAKGDSIEDSTPLGERQRCEVFSVQP